MGRLTDKSITEIIQDLFETVRELELRYLGQQDPLGKEMATHASILVWETPWTEEPGRLQSMGSQRVANN